MLKNDLVYIGHMLDTARKALVLVQGLSRADYDQDEKLRLALAHLIQIIGEAARRVSEQLKTERKDIPWKSIIGMRHKVVHDYMDLDEDVLWKTVSKELQPLIEMLEALTANSQ